MKNDEKMKKIEILIVEDSLTQAEELKFILEEYNYTVQHAVNGEIALQMLINNRPDIIISDIVMPGMDGYTFCSTLKSNENYKLIPVILLTSLSDPRDVIKGLECGADSFLIKPYNEEFLIARIRYFIDNAQLRTTQVEDKSPEVLFANQRYTILSSSRQILDILLSTYEDSIRKNEELLEANKNLKIAQEKLFKLNTSLEQTVKLRTQELENTNAQLLEEVVERKQLSEELQRSQLMLKSSLESPKDMIILSIDKNYHYQYFNRTHEMVMKKAYGATIAIGMNILECISNEEDRLKAKMNYDKALYGESHTTIQEYGENEISYYETLYNPTYNNAGEIIGITAFARDITERMKIEEALRQSEEQYRNLFNKMEEGFALHEIIRDENGVPIDYRFLEMNPAFESLTGLNLVDSKGKRVLEVMPETEKFWIDTYGKVALTGQFEHFENYARAIGKYFHVMAYSPAPNQFATFFYDVTEQKNAELKYRESNEFNQSLIKTIPFGMDIVDEEGNVLFLSDNLINTFGQDSVGRKCWQLYRDDKTQCVNCPLLSGIDVGKTSLYETCDVLGGRIFQISHTGMIFNGKKAILEIFQDISERKQNEQELIKAKLRAEESDRLKSSFLANMSHEIRTPLNSIIGFSELLTDPDLEAETQHEFANLINTNGNQLLSIISDIIDISKIETGQVEIKTSTININSFMQNIHKEFSFKANQKGIEFKLSIPENTENILLETDELKLRQVLVNLAGNALKFTNKGEVEMGYSLKNSSVEFFVKDTGIGISAEYHQRIFERFQQVESAFSRKYGGNGLGLPISRSLVELLGGNLRVDSEVNKGSTFYFAIPVKIAVMSKTI
jgi:PAS domain S-box-containing protein